MDSSDLLKGVYRLILPLYSADSRTTYKLAGSSFVFTEAGRIFIITAAHVADSVCRSPLVIQGATDWYSPPLRWWRTKGDLNDKTDIAIAEVPTPVFTAFGDIVDFTDHGIVSKDCSIQEGVGFAFVGFPQSINKKKTRVDAALTAFMYQGRQVAFNHQIYSKGYTPQVHLCSEFDQHECYTVTGEKKTSPHPRGLSGGIVFKEGKDGRGMSVIGMGIEVLDDEKVIIGIHIGIIFQQLRKMCPELSRIPIFDHTKCCW